MKEELILDENRLYYPIGEVSKMLNLETSTVRFWEKEFDILKPHRNAKGNRMFTQEDVKNLHTIKYLVYEKRLTLEGAKKKLKDQREGIEKESEIVFKLKNIRELLVEIRNNLDSNSPNEQSI